VLDIGTGTGFFAILAARLGARRVVAVEPSDAIWLAQEMAARNGVLDRIEFRQELSVDTTVDERANVLICDLRGVLPQFKSHIPALLDARTRLLAPGGVLIPSRDVLRVSAVESDELHRPVTHPWLSSPLGIDLSAGSRLVANQWLRAQIEPGALLAPPAQLGEVDYRTVTDPSFHGRAKVSAARAGTCHGLAVWFDAELSEGIGFSNAPGSRDSVYGQGFFPWPEGVALVMGDSVEIELRAKLVEDDYVWIWNSRVLDEHGAERIRFHQSSFYGKPLSRAALVPQAASEGLLDAG
jgi:protein arginine N-methyltransferase 1